MAKSPLTIEHVNDLAESGLQRPVLVRWDNGEVSVTSDLYTQVGATVLATQQMYLDYCDGQDAPDLRANFLADLLAQEG